MFTQGTPQLNSFNMDTAEFNAKFKVDVKITQPTRIYFSPEYYYPNSFTFDLSSGGVILDEVMYGLERSEYYLDILITDSSLQGEVIEVKIIAI